MRIIQDPFLPDVWLIEPQVHGDHRGYFFEVFRRSWWQQQGIHAEMVQINQSCSVQGILRGLHYQTQHPQGKWVQVLHGEIFDVAVDLRRSSPTWGRYMTWRLKASQHQSVWIPPGFAHGFYVLSEQAVIQYGCTDYYAPDSEESLMWSDPFLDIPWPILPDTVPQLSKKDAQGLTWSQVSMYP